MPHTVAVAVLCVAGAGMAAQWVAWRLKLPAIVLLFAFGLLVGPGLQVLRPAAEFGPGLQTIVGLAVAIVVFEGGLALDVRELRAAGEGVLRLTMVALPISFVLGTLAASLVGALPWRAAALYGAITTVTGPTVILPLIRNTKLERRASAFLKWEAIVNDPIGAVLATLVLAFVAGGREGGQGGIAVAVAGGIAVAVLLGVGSAFLIRAAVRHDLVPETLKSPIILAMALCVYAVANLVIEGAGLAAATIFGVALANMHIPGLGELTRFKESLVVLIVSALFVVLTANLDRSVFAQLSLPLLLLTAAMILVVRPLAIALATWRGGLTVQERVLAGWIAPRGIVAAAVAGVAGSQLSRAGVEGGASVMPAVFALIAATVVLHGFSLAPLARRLGLTLGDAPGLAIVGATPWTIALATALDEAGAPVLLIDSFPGALDEARRRGLATLQAEILSEHAEEELTGRRVDYLVAATADDVYNSLVCAKLAPELGRARVFQTVPEDHELWLSLGREWRGQALGAPALSFAAARRQVEGGLALRDGDEDVAAAPRAGDAPLILLRRNGDFAFASSEGPELVPALGDRLLVLTGAEPAVVPPAVAVDPERVWL